MNSRLDTIQAAVLQVKLQAFREYELDAVNKVAERYTEALKNVVGTPEVKEGFLFWLGAVYDCFGIGGAGAGS